MKKLLLILFLFLTIPTHSQSILAPPSIPEDELLLAYKSLKHIIDDTNLVVVIQPYVPLRYGMQGLTEQFHKNLYTISISGYINNDKIRKWVLLHEIGHVIDFHSGKLHQHPPVWDGELIDRDIEWEDRPWEQSAEDWALLMWILFIEETPPLLIEVE